MRCAARLLLLVGMLAGCTNDFDALFAGSAPGGSPATTSEATGTGAAGAAGGGAGAAGSGGEAPASGCADGSREAYRDELAIAGCSGGFEEPGVVSAASKTTSCDRQ